MDGGKTEITPTNLNWNDDPVQTANHCSAQGFIFDGATAYNFAPPTGFSVGGTISGLNASGLTLQLNGGPTLSIGSASTSFLFPNQLPSGQAHSVTITAQRTAQTCSINNGSGTINHADVLNLSITCSSAGGFTISGTVQGGSPSLTADTIPVTLTFPSGTETLNVSLTQTQFTFTTLLQNGQSYSVTSPAEGFQLPNCRREMISRCVLTEDQEQWLTGADIGKRRGGVSRSRSYLILEPVPQSKLLCTQA